MAGAASSKTEDKSESESEDKDKPSDAPTCQKVTTGILNNTMAALSGLTLLSGRTQQASWLVEKPPFPANEMLPMKNGLVHLPSLVDGRPAIMPPTPQFFCPYVLDYDFDPNATEAPNFFTFLHELWAEDQQSIDTVQEWFGYFLTPDTSQEKILVAVGPRRCGKGTLARILRLLIGVDNVANPTLSSLGTQFGLAPLIGKLAAVIGDARLSGRSDVAQVVERLLSISGEDAQTIDRKHLPAITMRLLVRFLIITNELPRFTDPSGALVGRMIILRMIRSFYGNEDTGLMDRIVPEMPAILNWAIEGWKRLRQRGAFVQPDSGKVLVTALEDLSNPVGAFVRDRCRRDPDAEIEVHTLFAAWWVWCQEKDYKFTGTVQTFGRDLRAVVPEIDAEPIKHKEGEKIAYNRKYQGIELIRS
jgi:putative DNA primase/helicase